MKTNKLNKKKTLKKVFEMFVNLFSTIMLWSLIWAGSVLALIDYGESGLAVLLIISGVAWAYRDIKNELNKK